MTLVRRSYQTGDLKGVFVAIAATDDGFTNAEAFQEAATENVLFNAVDDTQFCHFAVPSILRRGDLYGYAVDGREVSGAGQGERRS